MSEKFSLKWNDFHSNVSKAFGLFRNEDYLHDVTLVSDDHKQVSAHKLVLSASSEYFKDIFQQNNRSNTHPLLCLDGISSHDLNNVLDYIYNAQWASPLDGWFSSKDIFCQKIFDNFFSFQATEMVLTSKWGRIQPGIQIWADQVVAAS